MTRLSQPTRRLDALKWWLVFRSARTGQYVSRLYALRYPNATVSERRWR